MQTMQTNQYEQKVMDWIKDKFDMDSIVIEDFNVMPYGKRIMDMHGQEMAVFFDYWTDQVKHILPQECSY
ncbi:hypothetical protein [Siminovitchia terrae]|nr:hypothetical protein [Siminovitchia terrae]